MMDAYLTAEIGCNYQGDIEKAKEMIRMASQFCGVPRVKFQKRNPSESCTEEEYNSPHPDPRHSFGQTYGQHREFLELGIDRHRHLMEYCSEFGIEYSCSVWDMTSAREVAGLAPRMIKVPSACNTNYEMAGFLCDQYEGEIHVSLGMTSNSEIESIVEFYESRGRGRDLVIFHCTSAYPVDFKDLCLMEIARLKGAYGKRVKGIGFSGHHRGIACDVAAFALGARYFERHFTLDRTWKGTDQAASLEPDGLRRLWRDLKACRDAMTLKPKEILDVEEAALKKLKWDRNKRST